MQKSIVDTKEKSKGRGRPRGQFPMATVRIAATRFERGIICEVLTTRERTEALIAAIDAKAMSFADDKIVDITTASAITGLETKELRKLKLLGRLQNHSGSPKVPAFRVGDLRELSREWAERIGA